MQPLKLNIKNKTQYDGTDLRKLTRRSIIEFNRSRGTKLGRTWQGLNVFYEYKKREIKSANDHIVGVNGYATLKGNFIKVYLKKDGTSDARVIASILFHELYHSAGYTHSQMACGSYISKDYSEIESWVNEYQIKQKAQKTKYVQTIDNKIIQLEASKKRWESKKLRATNAVKKLDKKINYYQKKLAAGKSIVQ